jgi:hypothetical protein
MSAPTTSRYGQVLVWLAVPYGLNVLLLWISLESGLIAGLCATAEGETLKWVWAGAFLVASGYAVWQAMQVIEPDLEKPKALLRAIHYKGLALIVLTLAIFTGLLQDWPLLLLLGFIAGGLQTLFLGLGKELSKPLLLLVLGIENAVFFVSLTLPIWLLSLCAS